MKCFVLLSYAMPIIENTVYTLVQRTLAVKNAVMQFRNIYRYNLAGS